MVDSNKKHTGEHLDPEEKTARIRARFDAIAQAHGLIPSDAIIDVSEQVPQKVDIVIGDGGTILTEDESTSQIMEELPPPSAVISNSNTPILADRNNLQKLKSIISIYDADGKLLNYKYFGKSTIVDEKHTQKTFLKIQNTTTGNIDLWNGVISPIEKVRFAEGNNNRRYSEKPVFFSKIELKY